MATDILKEAGMNDPCVSKENVETKLLARGDSRNFYGKSEDTQIRAAMKGLGGNQTKERCIVIRQASIDN